MDSNSFINFYNINIIMTELTCRKCHKKKILVAKSLCRNCYQTLYYKKNYKKKVKKYGTRGHIIKALARDKMACQHCHEIKRRPELVVVQKNGNKKDWRMTNLKTLCRTCSHFFFKDLKLRKMRESEKRKEKATEK